MGSAKVCSVHALLLAIASALIACQVATNLAPTEITMIRIVDIYPDKATYRPGERAMVNVELENTGQASFAGQLLVDVYALAERVGGSAQMLDLPADAGRVLAQLDLALPAQDFRGYGVEVCVVDRSGRPVAEAATALDVLSAWWLAPRYGFLSDFAPAEPDTDQRVAQLAKYHVNVVQFYDWMYRHYQLLPPPGVEDYTDALGRRLSLATVRAKIAACKARNMATLAYGAVYGAEREFADQHPDWLLYQPDGRPASLAGLFHITDIRPGSPWCDLIVGEYCRAVQEMGFDGIHMDQYGFPEVAYTAGPEHAPVDVGQQFAPLINRAAQAVREVDRAARVLFNAVNNWPTSLVAGADQPAVYIEVWPPHTTYLDLRQLILGGRSLSGGKPVILAAYLSPFGERNAASAEAVGAGARLTMAAIFANGGYHLLLGERDAVLCEAYYPRHAGLSPAFAANVRRYYDFVVRYENLLYDPSLEDVSSAWVGGANAQIALGCPRYGPMARGGSIWTVARYKPGCAVLSLINLTGDENVEWNLPHPPPPLLEDVQVTLSSDLAAESAWWASPDEPLGRLEALPLHRAHDGRWGLTVPRLSYWDIVVIRTKE